MADSDFIVPPPGLIPALTRTPDSDAGPEQTGPTYPSFRPPVPTPAPPTGPAVPLPPPVAPPAAAPVSAPATAPVSAQEWVADLADGQRIVIGGAVVFGRAPSASRAHPDAVLVAVNDPARSVSKTHAMIELTPDGLALTDLHSTNGVRVRTRERSFEATAGRAVTVGEGDSISLGDFAVTIARG